MNSNAKVVKTNDGSHTIYLPDLNEHYHSIHGARQESEHVYIKMGIDTYIKENPQAKEVNILEVGFGTGLNALLTLLYANENKVKVNYYTLEPFPVREEHWSVLDFNFSDSEKLAFNNLHSVKWNEFVQISDYFTINKIEKRLEDFESDLKFSVIYFDAFAPNKQKNIWDSGNFLKLHSVLEVRAGIITTYCAQGEFKRTAKKADFQVVEKEGPPGKRVMTHLKIG